MKRTISVLAFSLVIAVLWTQPARAAPLVLDLTTGGVPTPCGSCGEVGETFGWSFTVSGGGARIEGLGVWDADPPGLGVPGAATGLWGEDGTLLASATITDMSLLIDSASEDGNWLVEMIDPVVLSPGSTYFIGTVFFANVPLAQIGAPFFTTIVQIELTGGVRAGDPNSGFAFPGDPFGDPIFGPTMVGYGIPLPEPGTLALLGLGLVGIGLRRRVAKAS